MSNKNFDFLSDKAEELKTFLSKDFTGMNEDDIMGELNETLSDLEDEFQKNETKLVLPFKKLHNDTLNPKYNYGGDSGFDLYSTEDILLGPFGRALIPTGLSFDISSTLMPPSVEATTIMLSELLSKTNPRYLMAQPSRSQRQRSEMEQNKLRRWTCQTSPGPLCKECWYHGPNDWIPCSLDDLR